MELETTFASRTLSTGKHSSARKTCGYIVVFASGDSSNRFSYLFEMSKSTVSLYNTSPLHSSFNTQQFPTGRMDLATTCNQPMGRHGDQCCTLHHAVWLHCTNDRRLALQLAIAFALYRQPTSVGN